MSTKSQGSHILAPDQPVDRFSARLESSHECLHRALCIALKIPNSIETIMLVRDQMRTYYYEIRNELESDGGITSHVAQALPVPNTSAVLGTLNAWEDSEEGVKQFEKRVVAGDGSDSFRPSIFWRDFRFKIYEAERALNITRERIAEHSGHQRHRRYLWLHDSHLVFDNE